MSVVKKLKAIAEKEFIGYSWTLENWEKAGKALARAKSPAILCLIPAGGMLTIRHNRAWNSPDVVLCFMDNVPRDAEGEEHEEVIERMMREAVRFIGEINRSGLFEPVEGEALPYDTIIDRTADIKSGFMIGLNLKEREFICL